MQHNKTFLLVLFLISLACCAFGQSGVALDAWKTADEAMPRAGGNFTGPVTASDDIFLSDGGRAASKMYVDAGLGTLESQLLSGNLILHYVTATDSLTGGRLLSTTPEPTASTIVYPALTSLTYVAVTATPRVTEAGQPGVTSLPAGTYPITRYYSKTAGGVAARAVTGVNELWRVGADGSSDPVFIATSSEYILDAADNVIQRADFAYSFATPVDMASTTNRLVEIHYRKRSGTTTGTDPIVTVYYGGDYPGFLQLSLPSAVVLKTDGSNVDNPTFLTNVQALPTTGGTMTGALALATTTLTPVTIYGGSFVTMFPPASYTFYLGGAGNSTGANAGYNMGMGPLALNGITTGYGNLAAGVEAAKVLNSGLLNVSLGWQSHFQLTSGSRNTGIGYQASYGLTSGRQNTAIGPESLFGNNGWDTIGIGYRAGGYRSDGTTQLTLASASIYLGNQTRSAQTSGDAGTVTNEVVIGYAAIGAGSNTVTLGNVDIERTMLRGEVMVATSTDAGDYKLQVAGNQYVYGKSLYRRDGNSTNIDAITLRGVPATDNATDLQGLTVEYRNAAETLGAAAGAFVVGKDADFTTMANLDGFAAIHTALDGTTAERMRITSDGNVGIGTSTPALELHVIGNGLFSGVPEHADNAAAVSAGLAVGTLYRTGDVLKIVH